MWLNTEHSQVNNNKADTECMLFGINHVRTKYDTTVRRGAIVKAMAFFSKYHFVEVRLN